MNIYDQKGINVIPSLFPISRGLFIFSVPCKLAILSSNVIVTHSKLIRICVFTVFIIPKPRFFQSLVECCHHLHTVLVIVEPSFL
ncbi:hypothetical protein L1887_33167 [Cichorium endivia]|nr:hypothetical protein L1887_33167 [Cichorium endivia]